MQINYSVIQIKIMVIKVNISQKIHYAIVI